MAKRKTKKSPAHPRKSRRASLGSRKSQSATATKLPKEAVTLIVQLRPREGQETLLEAELRALVGPTRKEDGCLPSAPPPATPARRTPSAGTPARTRCSPRATSPTGSKLFDSLERICQPSG